MWSSLFNRQSLIRLYRESLLHFKATIFLHLGSPKPFPTSETCGLFQNEPNVAYALAIRSNLAWPTANPATSHAVPPHFPSPNRASPRASLVTDKHILDSCIWRIPALGELCTKLFLAAFHAGTGSWSPDLIRCGHSRCAMRAR